ncbi:MAG TPA: hypothetical protein VK207_05590 [Bacteroidales bacterium]|nr:hypothetical protein [Bacteroidales bacterium]
MFSLRHFSVSLVLLFLFTSVFAGDPFRLPAGAGEAGMNYACITGTSFWSSFHNQASLAYNSSFAAGFSYENRFGLSELSTKTGAIVVPAGKASIAGAYSYFGYHDFRRHSAGLACGLKLSEKISAGAQVDYFSEMTYGEYEDHQTVSFEIGVLLSPSQNVKVGLHLFNPLPESLTGSLLPSGIRAGAGVNLTSYLFAAAEAEMTTTSRLLVRTGFEYEAFKKVLVRGGFCSDNTSFSFGLGYRLDFMQLDLGFVTHDRLGVTSSASMIFILKK